MKQRLIQLLCWLARKLGANVYFIQPHIAPLVMEAVPLCQKEDDAERPDIPRVGEFKRKQVYSRMMKNHPKTAHRDLGLAIELAIRQL